MRIRDVWMIDERINQNLYRLVYGISVLCKYYVNIYPANITLKRGSQDKASRVWRDITLLFSSVPVFS